MAPTLGLGPLFRSRLLVLCNARQCWSPVVVTTQSVGLCERVRSHNEYMYPYQPSGKIWSVVVAHQSENGIDDRARAAVSPSTSSQVADETYLPIYVSTDIVVVQDSRKQWVGRQRTATIALDRRKQKRRRFVIFR